MMKMIPAFAFLALLCAAVPAFAQPASTDLAPKLIKPAERDPRAAEEIQKNIDTLKDLFDKIKTLPGLGQSITLDLRDIVYIIARRRS